MQRLKHWIPRMIGAGLLVGAAGCQGDGSSDTDGNGSNPDNPGDISDLAGAASELLQAKDCPDLLTKIQDDAVMKAKLAAFRTKLAIARQVDVDGDGVIDVDQNGGGGFGGNSTGGDVIVDDGASPPPSAGGEGGGSSNGGAATGGDSGGAGAPSDPGTDSGGTGGDRGPTSASGTNTQVAGVDEADFVKLVKGGERMFLLHGSKLLALKSWPAAETALDGQGLLIEGSPSEMFVTEDGKRAVIFSSVYDYSNGIRGGAYPGDAYCGPDYCGGYGNSFTKVTVADVSGAVPKAVRELYYEGSYLSSRRYPGDKDVVRAIFQGYSRYAGLFSPEVDTRDAWGRPYEAEVIENQLNEWVERTTSAIRATKLEDWLPLVREAKNGKLSTIEPTCDAYYVPKAGLTDYGLTHVLSMDINDSAADLGGITIMGAAQTVYSNAEHLVLAQPDYRWNQWDFGLVDEQQSALHMFAINGADTTYEASGWVPGFVPSNNSQFAIDEKDGAIRIATTGWVRENPKAKETDPEFWSTVPSNHVFTTQADDGVLKIAGKSDHLGHPGETIFAARFVGDRGYVVTAVQNQDPLYVIDLKDATKPTILGEVEIPGFSQYVHPIDADHLVTVGQNGSGWGIQLQMFDVSNPMEIPQPKILDFGEGSSSEASFNHKAFTYFAEQNLLAVPLYNNGWSEAQQRMEYGSSLKVIKVSTKNGFDLLGTVNHSALYEQQNCGYCDEMGCYDYYCSYAPEVRRGHFVADDADTFVYSVSYGGVIVNNLDDLTTPVATAELPAPVWSEGSWYGTDGGTDTGGSNGSVSSGTSGSTGIEPEPPVDVMDRDGGSPEPTTDAGVDMQ